jgi:hypothetical protein
MVGADFGVGIYMLDVCALSGNVLGTDALLFVCLLDLIEGVSASFSIILHEESLSLRLMRLLACRTLFRSFILDYPRKIGDGLAAFRVRTVEPWVRTVEPWVKNGRTVGKNGRTVGIRICDGRTVSMRMCDGRTVYCFAFAFIFTFFVAVCRPKTLLLVVLGEFLVLTRLSVCVFALFKEIKQAHERD